MGFLMAGLNSAGVVWLLRQRQVCSDTRHIFSVPPTTSIAERRHPEAGCDIVPSAVCLELADGRSLRHACGLVPAVSGRPFRDLFSFRLVPFSEPIRQFSPIVFSTLFRRQHSLFFWPIN